MVCTDMPAVNSSPAQSHRAWCFTLHYGGLDVEGVDVKQVHKNLVATMLQAIRDAWGDGATNPGFFYYISQVEMAPETNKKHVQGYIELDKPRRLGAFKKLAHWRSAHLEPRRGTATEARAYCMKEESRIQGSLLMSYPLCFCDRFPFAHCENCHGLTLIPCSACIHRQFRDHMSYMFFHG